MELQSSHIIYDGLTHNTDCLSVCQYNTDLNSVLEDILNYVDTCSLTIPTCFDLADNKLLTILQAVLDKSCECSVKVSEDDNCCGYLEDKLISSDGSISFGYTKTNCQQIDLSANINQDSIVKYNTNTVASTTADSTIFKQVLIDSSVLDTDESSLILNFNVGVDDGSNTVFYTMLLNGVTIGVVTLMSGEYGSLSNLRINRISSTEIYLSATIEIYTILNILSRKYTIFDNSITVNDLDTLTNTFYLETGTILGVTMSNNFFTIDKFNK